VSAPLAVLVPVVGQPSETFLRRHVEQLLPGGTVVVARRSAPQGTWSPDVPTLWLDELGDDWGGAREQDAVATFLRAQGVRAVLAEYLDIWLPFLPVLAREGIRTVAHGHGYDVSSRLREPYWREAYLGYRDHAVPVVTMSQVSRARLLDLGLAPDQLHVVPYGVDVPDPVERPDRPQLHVLMAGRLVGKKNPLATLAACRHAADLGARLRITVIGDGPLRDEVQAAARGLDVSLRGARPHAEVLTALREADVFCQHSVVDAQTGDEEGLPVAILEAMAHGLPVVSTRHAGIPEAVGEGVSGLLVDEGDVTAMGRHLAALAADPGLRRRLGSAGRQAVLERFSWNAEHTALLQVLQLQDERIPT
jgi:glycosyltransferase involved in cell wall biosynthesis